MKKFVGPLVAVFLAGAVQMIPAIVKAAPQELSLSMVEGSLTIAGNDPATLVAPVRVSGMVETANGQFSEGTFTAAPISFEFPVEEFGVTADIEATFSQVAPGTATGAVNPEGDVSVDLELEADIHVEVRGANLSATCEASPVNIRLTSSAPYDSETGRVHLQNSNFSIPPIPTSVGGPCIDLIGGPVNDALVGSGHSIEMTMEGAIPLPGVGIHDTTTTLSVEPSIVRPDEEVVLEAVVTSEQAGIPTGAVEYWAGDLRLGSAPLDATGLATLSTASIPEGRQQLTAKYMGDDVFIGSTSEPVEYLVAVAPAIELDVPSRILIGGDPQPITATVSNGADGMEVENARLNFRIERALPSRSAVDPGQLVLEVYDGADWMVVPLVRSSASAVTFSVGPDTGFALPVDGAESVQMRLTAPLLNGEISTSCSRFQTVCPGLVEFTSTLAEVDPANGEVVREVVSETRNSSFLQEESLRDPTLTILAPVTAHTTRQGYSLVLAARVGPLASYVASGTFQALLDGEPLNMRELNGSHDFEPVDVLPLNAGGAMQGQALLPDDISPGEHTLTFAYSGDDVYGAGDVSMPITVLPTVGTQFVCDAWSNRPGPSVVGAELVMEVELPTMVTAGSAMDLAFDAAQVRLGRTQSNDALPLFLGADTWEVGESSLQGISFEFAGAGSGTATSMTQANGGALSPSPYPAEEEAVDRIVTLNEATASIVIDGAPGEEVPVVIDALAIDEAFGDYGIPMPMNCTPRHEAIVLGTVSVAGTEVTVDPTESVVGDDVTFTATVKPSPGDGTVVFRTAEGVLGAADVDADGRAVFTTSALSVGTHEVTAQFQGNDEVPANESDAVTITVLEEAVDPPVTEPPGTEPGSTEPGSTEPPGSEGPGGDGQGGPSSPGSTSGNKALPRTGADSKPMISLALAMAGLGVAVLGSRRFLFRK